MLTRDELAAWLRLCETPGLGRATARRLLSLFGSPEAVLAAPASALHEALAPRITRSLLQPSARIDALVEATWTWLQESPPDAPRAIVTLGDAAYPEPLLHSPDPPLLLYTMGRVELLAARSVAIVGSRHASPSGLENAHRFARELSARRITVVSGLALGVDAAAHDGALAEAGSTVAFVGTGLDRVYPSRHAELAGRIAREGLLASEYSLGTPPLAIQFPRRNRLIAGLTSGTLVVEAAVRSGSLITAREALEAGREVFAVPGSIHSPLAQGCHLLIQQGAKLVATVDDILAELGDIRPATTERPVRSRSLAPVTRTVESVPEPTTGDDAALLAALGYDPLPFDLLAARTGWPADRLAARLLELELKGWVHRLPGGLLQRIAQT